MMETVGWKRWTKWDQTTGRHQTRRVVLPASAGSKGWERDEGGRNQRPDCLRLSRVDTLDKDHRHPP
uniref:Uncharacterized protein n=1 Tax=Hyaloperonospora arabidopsidis (strain Emoy2) TaxID=559515 RepID=M4B2R9_HYAAE